MSPDDPKIFRFPDKAGPRNDTRRQSAQEDKDFERRSAIEKRIGSEKVDVDSVREVVNCYAKNHYERLGIVREADATAVADASRALLQQWDVPDDALTWKTAMMRSLVGHAATVLSDTKLRAEYDAAVAAVEHLEPKVQTAASDQDKLNVQPYTIPRPANDLLSTEQGRDLSLRLVRAVATSKRETALVNHPLHVRVLTDIALGDGGGPHMLQGYVRGIIAQLVPRLAENQSCVDEMVREVVQKTVQAPDFVHAVRNKNIVIHEGVRKAWLALGLDIEKIRREK